MTSPLIAVIDDDQACREAIEHALSTKGYHTVTAPWNDTTFALVRDNQPNLAILCLHPQHESKWHIFDQLQTQSETARIPVLVCCDDTSLTKVVMPRLVRSAGPAQSSTCDTAEILAKVTVMLKQPE